VLGEEPGLGLPNQHTKACPRFQTMHCWCPPATGPGQPHLSGCSHYSRPVPFQFSVKHHPATPATLDKKYVDLNVDLKLPMKSGPFFGHGMKYAVQQPLYQAQAYAAALSWMEKQNTAPITPGCTCAAKLGVIGHAAFCPLCTVEADDFIDAAAL
jgi:hypothetical protein